MGRRKKDREEGNGRGGEEKKRGEGRRGGERGEVEKGVRVTSY